MLKKALALIALFALTFNCRVNAQSLVKKFKAIGTFATVGNITYFTAEDTDGKKGIWKTDGTTGATTLIKASNVYIDQDYPSRIYAYNNKVYFAGNDAINGDELWQTDGTATGTILLKDINPQHVGNTGSQPNNYILYKGLLYFTATEDSNRFSLWKTDGTATGTVKVFDAGYTGISRLLLIGNSLYFTEDSRSLWKTDGTTAGTQQIPVDDYGTVEGLTNVNNELVFFTSENFDHYKVNLYKLNPTDDTPVKLSSYNAVTYGSNDIGNITAVGSKFFFSIRTSDINGNAADALWVSNGTADGTVMVTSKPYNRYLYGAPATNFIAYKSKLYFAAPDTHTLWTSDGTAGGTSQVSAIPENYEVRPVVFNEKLYFNGNNQLCYFDGTKATTEILQPLQPVQLVDGGNQLYFQLKQYGLSATLWSNAPAAQLQVTINYQVLANDATTTTKFYAKADSTVAWPVTVKNIGNKEMVFSEISVAGNSFYVNGTPDQILMPGKTANFNVLYSPFKEEQVSALLIIKTNDASGLTNFSGYLTGSATGSATKKASAVVGGLFKAIAFKDTVLNFTLTQNSVAETAAVNSTIGTFNQAGATTTSQFELVAGLGDTDNGHFKIEAGQLKNLITFNFDIKSTYTIRVKAGNNANATEKVFTINVTDVQPNANPAVCEPGFKSLLYSLNDAVYVGTRIVTVGTQGKILISDDDGKNWREIKTGFTSNLNRVRFTDGKTGYILAGDNSLLKTENGGDSWFPLLTPTTSYPYLNNMYFVSSTAGYVFGGDGIYKTKDGGRSWQKAYSTYNSLNGGWFADENNGFVCGTSRTLLQTTDGGKTWKQIDVPAVGENTALSAITFVNTTTGYLTSTAGDILQTKDGGKTWIRISTVGADGFTGQLYFVNESTGYFLSGYNATTLYKTTDGGQNWVAESGITYSTALLGMAINKTADRFCAVGHGVGLGYTSEQGSVIMLKNGTGNWEERSLTGNSTYNSGNLFASGTGYVIGEYSRKTTDGGITWKSLNIPYDYAYRTLLKSYFIDENIGFYSDYYSIYKTTDGAATWAKKNTDSTSGIRTIFFVNPKVGFYTTDLSLYKTTDGGDTWKKTPTPNPYYSLFSISFPDEQTGYLGGIGSTIAKTIDGGNTWKTIDMGVNQTIVSVGFFDTKVGLAGGIAGALYRTTDGGDTWAPVYTAMRQYTTNFQFVNTTQAYLLNKSYSGGIQEIYETKDAGLTWTLIYQTWTTIFGFGYNDGHLFITGDGGTIAQNNNPGMPPVNAGYIRGDTVTAAGGKFIYSVPPLYNAKYKWLVSGAESVEYQNSQVVIAWKSTGTHTLQVIPYNDCANGESRLADIDVQDMPDPILNGPDTALSKSVNIAYTANMHDGNTYSFTAANSTAVLTDANKALVSWDRPGMGVVTVVESNPKLNLKKSASINVTIKGFKLPENNFSVLVNSVTCKGSNNGFITVKALQPLSYRATVTGPGGPKDYAFTDSLRIHDLAPGVYNVCLSVTTNAEYKRCYDANVIEPKDITLYTVVNPTTKTVTLNLSGADNYRIDLNDKHYQTNGTQIDLPLTAGTNRLKVYSDKLCQGIIEKVLNLNKVTIYPNPFTDRINIDLGGNEEPNVTVEVTNAIGTRVYLKQFINKSEPIEINTAGFSKGVYILKLTFGQSNAVFKIIK